MAVQRKLQAELIEKLALSDEVHKYRFKPFKRLPRFKAGQFLHLAIDEYDPSFNWPESRVFSIASSPDQLEYIDILISTVGRFTRRMKDELKLGDKVWLKLPYGEFNFSETENRDCVLIAGGTGISPFISFLESANNRNATTYLAYGVRNKRLLIIKDLISKLKTEKKNFRSDVFIEEEQDKEINSIMGRMNTIDVINQSFELQNPIYYLSGPPAMIYSFKEELLKNNIEEQSIRFDNWE